MTPLTPPSSAREQESAAPAEAAPTAEAVSDRVAEDKARPAEPTTSTRPRSLAVPLGLLKAMRPRQWVKNVLVLAAPFAAGRLLDLTVLPDVALAFVAFSLAASGVYLINDTKDVEADRAHPKKRHRPIAAGIVPPALAVVTGIVLFAGALGVSFLADPDLLTVTGIYIAVQLAYCLWLKHEPVIDICIVSSGFLMRAIAGGAAAGLYLSPWFLLTMAFGSLFMASGKRYAEMRLSERTGAKIRKSLERYSASYLRFVWSLSATVVIMAYGLWAFGIGVTAMPGRLPSAPSTWAIVSIVPFVVAVLRYAVDVDGGNGGEPEEIVLGDRVLQVLGLVWVVLIGLAVYTAMA
ncbi:decaprenyl-phosphate phosphoribosyltransferase [Actinomycetospora straminea]|uniref:Decaprenyl-phosphate phosphoribosyltransferase n=1 Tax=Actinomycetospora straminea TaxID=663607 RepID=A0ABP9E7E9_9PSEU|nr:decaprenyl-phosphate phosphoribosyltransferase [Actinomycetospora straminea]MDD7932595.1 decaprenyl-phosphate phosphoribosyltransferase [Actinomycetospora straminea]